jgi:DNA-binding transcriptional ArsR family regulator
MTLHQMTSAMGAPGETTGTLAAVALPSKVFSLRSAEAAAFLKALSHEGRLLILCHLTEGERSVTELEHLLDQRQAAVSQQLARLRLEGLVSTRREGKAIFYSIQDPKVLQLVRLMHDLYRSA